MVHHSAAGDREQPDPGRRLDGEALEGDTALLDAHLAGCVGCRDFCAAAERLHRGMRLRAADVVPDLTTSILAAAAADRGGRITASLVLRWLLVVVAALEVGFATPALLGRWHTGDELSTWGVATAIGFLSVAHRPARAAALLPMLVGASLLTGLPRGLGGMALARRGSNAGPPPAF